MMYVLLIILIIILILQFISIMVETGLLDFGTDKRIKKNPSSERKSKMEREIKDRDNVGGEEMSTTSSSSSNSYIAYLEQKIEFLEAQVKSDIKRYDKGGTLIEYPDYKDWLGKQSKKPTTPLSERNHPMI